MVNIETMETLTPQVLTLLPATARAVAKRLGIERPVVTAILMGERKKKITEIKEKGGKIWSIVGSTQVALPLKTPPAVVGAAVFKSNPTDADLRRAVIEQEPLSGPGPKSLMVEVAELSVRVKMLEKFVGIVR